MDKGIIFVKTAKGEDEINNTTSDLYGDVKRVLVLIDEKSTVKELRKRAAPSLRVEMEVLLQELLTGSFIQDQKAASNAASPKMSVSPNISTPSKISNPTAGAPEESNEPGLDFTGSATAQMIAAEVENAKAQAEAEAWVMHEAKQDHPSPTLSSQIPPIAIPLENVDINAEKAALKARLNEQRRAEAAAALLKAEQAAAAKLRAAQETEAVRFKVEQEAAKIKAAAHEAEMARIKMEAEVKARIALEEEQAAQKVREAERARIQAEVARQQAEQAAMRAMEEARVQAGAKLQAEQEAVLARARMEVEVQVRAKLEAEQAATHAMEEARVQAEAAKLKAEQDEARIKAELLATRTRAQAEEAARLRAEAEQRAKLQAAQARQVVTPQAEAKQAAAVPVQRVSRSARKPLPVIKISLMLIILAVGAAFLLPYVLPMEKYISQAEQTLSTQLKQPVTIGEMYANLLPMPKLELKNVVIGNQQAVQAESVVLNFNLMAVFAPIKEISKVEISNMVINPNSFSQALPWLAAAGRDALYPVRRMVLAGISVKGFELPATHGVLDFNGQGELVKAVLDSEDKRIRVQLQPLNQSGEKSGQGNWKFGLLLREGRLPLLPDIQFTELNISGLVNLSEANLNEIEGFLYGGKLTGNARMTWAKGWQMLGQLNLSNMELQEAMPQLGVMGKLDGDASLNLRAGSLVQLTQSPQMSGKFEVKKGAINAFDLVEVTRPGGSAAAGSGRTHFDGASGTWQVANSSYQLRQIKIVGGMMNASGTIDLSADKKLSGKLNVDLQAREEMGSVVTALAGTLAKPELQAGGD